VSDAVRKQKANNIGADCAVYSRFGCHDVGASGEYESMESREKLMRLKKFQVEEKRRKVAQIGRMIAEFERIAGDLEREIKTE
jgi:hypothetical protein